VPRAGFVASMPGTPEFCPRKDTPQVVHCDDGRISTRPYLPTLAQVFPIAAVTYLPGQRDATQQPHPVAMNMQ
jgi:hypothetical protein